MFLQPRPTLMDLQLLLIATKVRDTALVACLNIPFSGEDPLLSDSRLRDIRRAGVVEVARRRIKPIAHILLTIRAAYAKGVVACG